VVGSTVTQAVLDDYMTAPIDDKLRAALGLLRKMALEPEALAADDVRPLLALGVSRRAVVDALYVGFLFNIYDRLADTLGWEVPSAAAYDAGAKQLLSRGYR
jgi:alkylhydroperoxidase family enzyme